MTKRYYAVIQLGHAIFGVGDSKKSAIEEAKYWVDEPETLEDDIAPSADAVDGDLIIAECSQSLHDAVNQQGGDVLFEERDGVYQLTSEAPKENNGSDEVGERRGDKGHGRRGRYEPDLPWIVTKSLAKAEACARGIGPEFDESEE